MVSFAPYSPLVGGPPTRAGQRANAFHLFPHRAAAVDSVGIKLDSHSLRVKVNEINLNVKDVLIARASTFTSPKWVSS
jgi:hypothetical protein